MALYLTALKTIAVLLIISIVLTVFSRLMNKGAGVNFIKPACEGPNYCKGRDLGNSQLCFNYGKNNSNKENDWWVTSRGDMKCSETRCNIPKTLCDNKQNCEVIGNTCNINRLKSL